MNARTPGEIVVATHNVLADSYIRREYYPRCSPQDFLAEARHPRLVAYEAALGADVLCLQEVEYPMFVLLDERLRPLGYRGRWAHKERGKPDGCATFVRAPLTVLRSRVIVFDDAGLPQGPSGQVALVTDVGWGDAGVTVLNAHIKWDKPGTAAEHRYGLAQARQILDVLAAGRLPAVVCGDLNVLPDDAVIGLLRTAGFVDAHGPEAATFLSNGVPQKLDYLMHDGRLTARPIPPPPLASGTALPSAKEPSDHLPLLAGFSAR